MDLASWVQILNEVVDISLWANALGKGINPSHLLPAMGKIVGHIGFYSPDKATSIREGKLWIQTSSTLLKNWLYHTSHTKKTEKIFTDEDITVLQDWLVKSSDLSIIKPVWTHLYNWIPKKLTELGVYNQEEKT